MFYVRQMSNNVNPIKPILYHIWHMKNFAEIPVVGHGTIRFFFKCEIIHYFHKVITNTNASR